MITFNALAAGARTGIKSIAGVKYRTLIERSWEFSAAEFQRFQEGRFRSIYNWARISVPYYIQRRREYPELTPERNVYEFLQRLPLLPKPTVREHNTDFWAKKKGFLRTTHRTSGSTGSPLLIAATLSERGLTEAIQEAWFRRICGSRHPRTLALSGFMTPNPKSQELFWEDPISRRIFLSIYSLSPQRRDEVIRLILRFRPSLIFGYSSALGELANLIGDAAGEVRSDAVAVVTAETLQEHERELISRNLASRVFNLYGSQEGSHMALECERHTFHIMPLAGIIEILDEYARPVKSGAVGKVVVTGLSKPTMPLFRYIIGDLAQSTGYSGCGCGLGWPTIGPVEGRNEDRIQTPDGRRIGLLGDSPIKRIKGRTGIREAQLIQRSYERFELKLVLDSSGAANRDHLEREIAGDISKRLGYPALIKFEYIDEIPRGQRGKFKAVIVDFEDNRPMQTAVRDRAGS
jgi:phenylacetate-CoA ligase